jgi:hypothetical protein
MTDPPPSSPSQPHDKLFKALLADPALAGTLLRERLPAEIVALLSADPPEAVDGSFIDDSLRGSQSDRLFRLRGANGDDVLIYALIEHKSVPDPGLPLQLLEYMARIWRRHAGRGAKRLRALPPIIPMVLYHGAPAWTVPLSFRKMIAASGALRRYQLDFRYVLADLGRIEDPMLSRAAALRAGLLALKHAFRVGDPWPVLLLILETLPENHPLLLPLLLYCLTVFKDVDRPMLVRALRQAKPEWEAAMVSLAAREWLAEGRQAGLVEGRVEGRVEGQARSLRRLLVRRFGPIPPNIDARIAKADIDALDRWFDLGLDAPTLMAVFDGGQGDPPP